MPVDLSESKEPKLPNELLPQHVLLLERSHISPEVAKARGYRSLKSRDDIRQIGFQPRQGNVPALAIPVHTVNRQVAFFLIRPDQPRSKGHRIIKYEQPKNTSLRLDVPPSAYAALSVPSKVLWIADGPRQADAVVSAGRACIAVLGYRA